MHKQAVGFPGQGVQKVGMTAKLPSSSRRAFAMASEILDFDLWELVSSGPQEVLSQTQFAQPAILVSCWAIWEQVQDYIRPAYFAGHSLGEVTACLAGGALDFCTAVRVVQKRGELMAKAPQGGMRAVIGMQSDEIDRICASIVQKGLWIQAANFNAPGQIVVSGEHKALDELETAAVSRGARRVIALDVSGPFHSRLMEPVAAEFSEFLGSIEIRDLRVPVLANTSGQPIQTASQVRSELAAQLVSPVFWTDTIRFLQAQEVTTFWEISPVPLLTNLGRKTSTKIEFRLAQSEGDVVA